MVNSEGLGDSLEMTVCDQIRNGATILGAQETERIACDLHALTTDHTIEALVAGAGCVLRLDAPMPPPIDVWLMANGVILLRAQPDSRAMNLATLYAVAQWLLRDREHSRADEWKLALTLAIPISLFDSADAANRTKGIPVPDWAIKARLEMLSS